MCGQVGHDHHHEEYEPGFIHQFRSCQIREQESLADKTWIGTVGSAHYYCEPTNIQMTHDGLWFAIENNLRVFVLGQGANVLVSDTGFSGLVIRPQLQEISIKSRVDGRVLVSVGSGATIDSLITWCLDQGLVGLEELSGIPSTIGGALYHNLHYYNFSLAALLHSARVMHRTTGSLVQVTPDWIGLGQEQSKLHDDKHLVIDAMLHVREGTEEELLHARNRRAEILSHRSVRYPEKNCSGFFFKNFQGHEVGLVKQDGKLMLHASYYLDCVQVRGQLRVRNAMVSDQHPNMIVNLGGATSYDVAAVAREMQERVRDQFSLILRPGYQLVGFNPYPLI
jgi:UDP-N-acetylmuramate dehydrogenase